MPWTPPTNPEDSYELSPFGFGPFPLPGESVEVIPPHPFGGGFGGVGFMSKGDATDGGTPFGLSSYGSRGFGRPRLNISGGYGGDPYGFGGYGGTEAIPPYVSAVISISGFELEVFFSEEVDTTNPALTEASSYTLEAVSGAAPATVLSVHIESLGSVNLVAGDTIAGALSVIVTHTGTTLGGTYRVHVTDLTDISGNVILDVDASFLARGTPPVFVATIPAPETGDQVLVTFDQNMLRAVDYPSIGPGIDSPTAYVFDSIETYPIDLVATAAEQQADATKVLLTVKGMTSLEYALTVGPSFAFSYDPVGGLQAALRVDTGTGTAVVSGSNLVVGRLANNAFGLEWQDQSGSIVPLISTLRMDCYYDFSNAVYDPAITSFPLPEVIDVVFQDGIAVNGVLVRFTLQYGLASVEQIRLRSGLFDVTVDATWSGGPHRVSFVRNMKAGTVTFLLDDYPLTSTAIGNVTGVPETQAGIRVTLLNGGWDLSGCRILEVKATSSQTIFSNAWNFLHEGSGEFVGSSKLAKDTLLTQRGPLVKAWGDATPATKQDVSVIVNGVAVEIDSVNPYIGEVTTVVPIPLLPYGDPQADVKVDYQWFKSPVMELAGLNTEGLVLNKFDCRHGHHDPASHGDAIEVKPDPPDVPMSEARPKGAVDTHRFPMGVVLGPLVRQKPLYIGHRYMGFERAYSALTNSPTTLVLNQASGRSAVPGFDRTVQGVSVAYEGLVRPTDSSPAWALSGTDYGGVDHDAETGLDLGTFTVIDAKIGAFDPANLTAVVYRRGVDLSFPSSVYLVTRFQVADGALFDSKHLNPGGVATATTTDGVFTGIGFGIHDNQRMYFCGALRVNGVEHVGLLLDPKRPQEVGSWAVGPKSILTASKQDQGTFPTIQVPKGFVVGSRFQVLIGPQAGVYTATSVVAQTSGSTTVVFTPDLPVPWDKWGQKYPEVVFETRTTSKPFTYRIDINTDQQVAELRISGEIQGVVASVDGNVPVLPAPALTSLLLPMDGAGQVFWGSLSRQAASRATWSFTRYGVVPDQVFLQGHAVVVNTEMTVVPENDTQAVWFPRQDFGYSTILNADELLLKTGVSHSSLDFTFGYSRTEPFFSPDALFDLRAKLSLESGTLGSGDVELLLDDTQRVIKVVPLLYDEGFVGETTYRRLVNLPAVSTTGFMLPETLDWSAQVGNTLVPVVEGDQFVTIQSLTERGGWAKDLDWDITNPPTTDDGRIIEARLAVTDFTANVSGDTGIRFGCQMPGAIGNAVVQVELRGGVTPGVRLRTAAGVSLEEYDFDWTDEVPHTYRVIADRDALTVSLIIDDAVQLPIAALGDFNGGVNAVDCFFGCYGVNGSNVLDAAIACTVEWHHFHCHVMPPITARRTLGVWLGGDKDDINAFEIPRTDTSVASNSWAVGPVIQEMDWRSTMEVRLLHDPGWGVTVFRPDLPAPPYYQPEAGDAGQGFITDATEPSAGWINVEYRSLPRSPGLALGQVSFGSLDKMSLSQSRWDWVRYRMFRHPTEERYAPEHMLLNQFNVITSGELTQDIGLEQVIVVTLDKTRLTLLPTHLYAASIYKVIDGAGDPLTSADWLFDKTSQTLTLQQDPKTGDTKEFTSEHATVTVFFIPGKPVTNTYLLAQPLLDGITKLNEGTPPVPKSQIATAEIQIVQGSHLNEPEDVLSDDPEIDVGDPYRTLRHRDVTGTLYENLDFYQVDDGGDTGLISSICEGGPGTGFSGQMATEGEEVYSLVGDGDSLGGVGGVANHFATGDKVGKAVGAEVFEFSGTMFWQEANFPASPVWTQKGGSPGGILFASGGNFVNPVVDGAGNIIPGVLVAGGGNLGPGTAVLWPSFPAKGPVGGDQGRIYKRTDWLIQWSPGEGSDLNDTLILEGADRIPPTRPLGWNPNVNGAPQVLGSAFGLLQYAGDYSRMGPWGGLKALTPDKDYGTFRFVIPVDGAVVQVWDPIPAIWVTFTAKAVPVGPTDFALAPTPHIALAASINAYPFSTVLLAEAGLTLSGQMMVQVTSETPVDTFSNPLYLRAPNPAAISMADVIRLPDFVGMLQNGSGVTQSSLLAGGSQTGAITTVPNLLRGMVAQGGSALPVGAQFNLTF